MYLRTKRKVPLFRPEPTFNKTIAGTDFPHNINNHPHSQVCNVDGVDVAGICDGDSTFTALGDIYLVEAGAGCDNQPKGRKMAEDVGGDLKSAGADGGLSVLSLRR